MVLNLNCLVKLIFYHQQTSSTLSIMVIISHWSIFERVGPNPSQKDTKILNNTHLTHILIYIFFFFYLHININIFRYVFICSQNISWTKYTSVNWWWLFFGGGLKKEGTHIYILYTYTHISSKTNDITLRETKKRLIETFFFFYNIFHTVRRYVISIRASEWLCINKCIVKKIISYYDWKINFSCLVEVWTNYFSHH